MFPKSPTMSALVNQIEPTHNLRVTLEPHSIKQKNMKPTSHKTSKNAPPSFITQKSKNIAHCYSTINLFKPAIKHLKTQPNCSVNKYEQNQRLKDKVVSGVTTPKVSYAELKQKQVSNSRQAAFFTGKGKKTNQFWSDPLKQNRSEHKFQPNKNHMTPTRNYAKSPFASKNPNKNNCLFYNKSSSNIGQLRVTLDARIEQNQAAFFHDPTRASKQKSLNKEKKSTGSFWKNKKSSEAATASFKRPAEESETGTCNEDYLHIPTLSLNFESAVPPYRPTFVPSKKSINRFKFIKIVGENFYSRCYMAVDKETGFLCCIKTIKKTMLLGSHEFQHNFMRAVKFQLWASNSNIVSLYDVLSDKDNIYLVEEYMEGKQLSSLFQYLSSLENEEKKQAEILQKISEIAFALQYLHAERVAHGNIRPQQIFLNLGSCKIKPLSMNSNLHTSYISPECLLNRKITPKSDMWCIGLLIFELCTGQPLFDDQNGESSPQNISEKIVKLNLDEIFLSCTLSNPLKDLIKKLLVINPEDRIGSSELIKSRLIKMCSAEDTLPNCSNHSKQHYQ